MDPRGRSFSVLNPKNERMNALDAEVNLDDRKMVEGSVKPLSPGLSRVQWKAVAGDDRAVAEGSFTVRIREEHPWAPRERSGAAGPVAPQPRTRSPGPSVTGPPPGKKP